MINVQAINDATEQCLAKGLRVLNSFLLRDTEEAHARRLLELMDPPRGAVIVDAGCGVGELAKLMAAARPDLAFTLVNISEAQLALCPPDMKHVAASYDATGLPHGYADVVMFNFSLCHSDDWGVTLREAFRILKPDGVLFIFDMARISEEGSNTLMRERYLSMAYRPAMIMDVARRAGFDLADPNHALGHEPLEFRLRDLVPEDAPIYDAAFAGVIPLTLRLRRLPDAPPVASAFDRHERIAFQFSGGRDSTAALYLLRPYWTRMTVYFLDSGEVFPETLAVLEQVERDLPQPIVRIQSDVAKVREEHGLASDVVPVDNTPLGRMVSGRTVKIISRYECCARTLMNPMHARMLADGITLIVRGQRDDDYASPPARSGRTEGGIEVLYPIQPWTTAQVDAFLAEHRLPVAPFYEAGMPHGSDCMGCTAWWGEGRAAYLQARHPDAHAVYRERMNTVRTEITRQLQQLEN
ncbi:MAG: hypothetical protein JWQ03_595 [Variovorax sp.]|nr:hypothetical protein [Variovorax sp.]